jgi:hypothetical protein
MSVDLVGVPRYGKYYSHQGQAAVPKRQPNHRSPRQWQGQEQANSNQLIDYSTHCPSDELIDSENRTPLGMNGDTSGTSLPNS